MRAAGSATRPPDPLDQLAGLLAGDSHQLLTPEIRQLGERCRQLGRSDELAAFLERVDRLSAAERTELAASMDEIQLRSKLWLIEQLGQHRDLGASTLVVLGAWCGILPLLINCQLERRPPAMRCIDIDGRAVALGRR